MSGNILSLRKRLKAINTKIKSLKQEKEKLRKQLSASCTHPALYVRERPYQAFSYGPCMPPKRICILCGVTENGWGCGHKILLKHTGKITAAEFRQIEARFDYEK